MMGKPIVESREEIDTAIERTQVFSDLAEEALAKEVIKETKNSYKSVIKEAVRF